MLLFELDSSPLLVSIVGIFNQLKAEVDSGFKKTPVTQDDVIDLLHSNRVYIDINTLRNMANKPPLNNLITLKNNEVHFKGREPEPEDDSAEKLEKKQAEQEKTVSSMADKAMKKKREPKISSKLK